VAVNPSLLAAVAIEEAALHALRGVALSPEGPDIVTGGQVFDVAVTAGVLRVFLEPERLNEGEEETLADALPPLLLELMGVERVVVKHRPRRQGPAQPLPGIGQILAVHSGKGGVGKSTVTVNLAVALARRGWRVGVLDADVYGPSCPRLLGLSGRAEEITDDAGCVQIRPFEAHGVRLMSLGFLVPPGEPLAWRGALVDTGLRQLVDDVAWGDLDLLLIDLPPGTSDVHLALAKQVPLTAVVSVSSPGQVAIEDVRRGMELFADLAVPTLGLVENMAGLACLHCGEVTPVFGQDGVTALADELGLPLLATLPFDSGVVSRGDEGLPETASDEAGPVTAALATLTERVIEGLRLLAEAAPERAHG
jgi:ATP-binding protein involved in chromosome partitioning